MKINRIVGKRYNQLYVLNLHDARILANTELFLKKLLDLIEVRNIQGVIINGKDAQSLDETTVQFLEKLFNTLAWPYDQVATCHTQHLQDHAFQQLIQFFAKCESLDAAIYLLEHTPSAEESATTEGDLLTEEPVTLGELFDNLSLNPPAIDESEQRPLTENTVSLSDMLADTMPPIPENPKPPQSQAPKHPTPSKPPVISAPVSHRPSRLAFWILGLAICLLPLLGYQCWKVMLFIAVDQKNVEAIDFLTQDGQWSNVQSLSGKNILMHAIQTGNQPMALYLIHQYPISLHTVDFYGRTALMHAVQQNNLTLVQQLLSQGADPTQSDPQGQSALSLAKQSQQTQIVYYLTLAQEGWFRTLETQDLSAIQTLLDSGVDINRTNSEGKTGLMLAAQRGHLDVVKFLVLSGAQLEFQSSDGQTALSLADAEQHLHVVDWILKQLSSISE